MVKRIEAGPYEVSPGVAVYKIVHRNEFCRDLVKPNQLGLTRSIRHTQAVSWTAVVHGRVVHGCTTKRQALQVCADVQEAG